MKIVHMHSPEFGAVPIIDRRVGTPVESTALEKQINGCHYKQLKIQPIEYIYANNIPYMEGNVIKYITRWRDKAGVVDLEKAKHYIEMLIEFETKNV